MNGCGYSNLTSSLVGRETGATIPGTAFEHAAGNSRGVWQRMALDSLLVGHRGCVNHVEFNDQGTLLATGSDDLNVCLWDLQSSKPLGTYETGHAENIFCVKFLPTTSGTNQPQIATCAGDGAVILHDLASGSQSVFNHHMGRVKKLVTEPGNPHLIISCSEDGTVRQIDIRQPASQATQLLQLARNGVRLEINSISAPWHKPWLLAVGASDDLLRVFDRRTTGTTTGSRPRVTGPKCVAHFTPGSQSDWFASDCITGVALADDGSQVLANYLGDHVYLWSLDDLTSSKPLTVQQQAAAAAAEASRNGKRPRQDDDCSVAAGSKERATADDRSSFMQSRTAAANHAASSHQAGAPAPTAAGSAQEAPAEAMQADNSAAASLEAAAAAAGGGDDADGVDGGRPASRVLSVDAALELLERGELHLPRRRVGAVASMILNRAQDLYERGEMEASLRYANAALQLRPNFGMAHYQCAICHEQLGDPAAALAAGEAALQHAWGYDLQQFVRRLRRNMRDYQQQQEQQEQQQQLQDVQQQQQQEGEQEQQEEADAPRPLPPALQRRLQARGILRPPEGPAAAAAAHGDEEGGGGLLAAVTEAASGGSEEWSPASSDGSSSSSSSSDEGSSSGATSSSGDDGTSSNASSSSSGDSLSHNESDAVATSDLSPSDNDDDHYMLGEPMLLVYSDEYQHMHDHSSDGSSSSSSGDGDDDDSDPDPMDIVSTSGSDVSWLSDDDSSEDEEELEDMLGLDIRHRIYDWGSSPRAQQQQQLQEEGPERGGQQHDEVDGDNGDRQRFKELLEPLRHQLMMLRMRQQHGLLDVLQRQRKQLQLSPQLQSFLVQESQHRPPEQDPMIDTKKMAFQMALGLLLEQQQQQQDQQQQQYQVQQPQQHLQQQQAPEQQQAEGEGAAPAAGLALCRAEVLTLLPVTEEQQHLPLQQLQVEQAHVLSTVLLLLEQLPDAEERKQRLMDLRVDCVQTMGNMILQTGQQRLRQLSQQQQQQYRDLVVQYSTRVREVVGDQLATWQRTYEHNLRLLRGMTFEDNRSPSAVAALMTAVYLDNFHQQQQQRQRQQTEQQQQREQQQGHDHQQQDDHHHCQQQQQQQGQDDSQQHNQHEQQHEAVAAGNSDAADNHSESDHEHVQNHASDDGMGEVLHEDDLLDERDPLIYEIGKALAAGDCGSSKQSSTPRAAAGGASFRVGAVLLSEHEPGLHTSAAAAAGGGSAADGLAAGGGGSAGCTRQHNWSCRYRGHVSLKTVKDVGFLGPAQNMVAAGSDDGRLFVWDRYTGELITALRADRYVVNCIAGHPNLPIMASCGIDNTVKLWTPCLDQPRRIDRNMLFCLGYNEIERSAESSMMHTGFDDMCRAFSKQRATQLLGQMRQEQEQAPPAAAGDSLLAAAV